ncbi:right-handed parallel beta-helix repeat-containing protein [Dyadobacter sp. CY261]|uniref:right-handed parallel beta-helix repeat-containing protein n=1 Tax=Dyadobacter sp. CY261 TaxID=2907203 RepID=UPI001F241F22|nr:right-handed parallel beta-helix repeat-containing protein [Dyadobacter sp. CY261]MCF0075133.1 right-handed parallel beta-helix repeat-containing protein [Dyadobacter sp. CY261]
MLLAAYLLFSSSFLIGKATIPNQDTIYVAPTGNDQGQGTLEDPVQSLSHSIELSRSRNVKTICLRGGDYFDVSIKLLPKDSGLNIVSYPNERPRLVGGVKVSQFRKINQLLSACIPNSRTREWDFRMIIINGEQRQRARLPKSGFYQYLNKWDQKSLPGTQGFWSRQPNSEERTLLRYRNSDLDKVSPVNAELTLYQEWLTSYSGLSQIASDTKTAYLTIPSTLPLGAFAERGSKNNKFIVWNTREGLNYPGQWYLDRTTESLVYWPKSGEQNDKIVAIIPKNRSIIEFDSTGVKDVRISGVEICAATNKLQKEEFSSLGIDAAISGDNLKNVLFEKIVVRNCGGSGFKIAGRNIRITDSQLHNIGGSGIVVKGHGQNKISNCTVSDVGLIFFSSVGIYAGNGTSVINCQIKNVPYTGISISGDSVAIENNSIQDVMTELRDGAAIYTSQHKFVHINSNRIAGHGQNQYGIYFDEKSDSCSAQNNIVESNSTPIHVHLSSKILVQNNLFIVDSIYRSSVQKSYDILFQDNIVFHLSRHLQSVAARIPITPYDSTTLFLSDSCTEASGQTRNTLAILGCDSRKGSGKSMISDDVFSLIRSSNLRQLKHIRWPASSNK